MNNKSLEIRMRDIEKDINELENIDGIKKLVNKHNLITNNINYCKNAINSITDKMNIIDKNNNHSENESENESENSSEESEKDELENSSNEIGHDKFITCGIELEGLKQRISGNIDNLDLEEMMILYNRAIELINESNKYLKQQKIEIININ